MLQGAIPLRQQRFPVLELEHHLPHSPNPPAVASNPTRALFCKQTQAEVTSTHTRKATVEMMFVFLPSLLLSSTTSLCLSVFFSFSGDNMSLCSVLSNSVTHYVA